MFVSARRVRGGVVGSRAPVRYCGTTAAMHQPRAADVRALYRNILHLHKKCLPLKEDRLEAMMLLREHFEEYIAVTDPEEQRHCYASGLEYLGNMGKMASAGDLDYSSKDYWTKFYNSSDPAFEWYCTFEDYESILPTSLPAPGSHPSVLVLGCGDAPDAYNLQRKYGRKVVAIDYVADVIKTMKEKNHTNVEYKVLDMADMNEVPDASIGLVFDKAAMDSVLSDPNIEAHKAVLKRIEEEVRRVLLPGGSWVVISCDDVGSEVSDAWTRVQVTPLGTCKANLHHFKLR